METVITIEEAINNSRNYAKRGDKLAKDSIKLVKNASINIIEKLDLTIQNLNEKNVNGSNGVEGLVGQLNEIRKELSVLPDKMLDDVKCISKKTINITLFGRTMAGKSTLMEILTHGNGDTIGKGYQRTTRDVREYSYKGLTITDVPGIAAFEGREDEEIAYKSAKRADLIIFLITDDAPQASEAECLRKILNLGKPVVCLINIKANIDEKTSMKMFLRDIDKKMSTERLEAIKNQFLSFGGSFGQTWDMLTFEFVHLKAAYLAISQCWNQDHEELYRLSRFGNVEKLIADEVTKNSCYYKIKAYIDTVVVPLMTTADILIQQAYDNRNQRVVIEEKKEKLNEWLKKFEIRGNGQIDRSLNELKNQIKREIPIFSERYYSDRTAGEKWVKVVEKYKVKNRCQEILNQLATECEDKLNEIYREITAELKFSSVLSSESKIQMNSVVDGKRIWNWGVTITSGVLYVLSLLGVPVVGWIALGVNIVGGLFSFLFKSKTRKIMEARKNLERKINENLDKQFNEINKQMKNIFKDDLIEKQVNPSFALFDNISSAIDSISCLQNAFAHSLYDKQEEIDRVMIMEAASYMNLASISNDIIHISRLPGACVTLCLPNVFDKKEQGVLESLIKETVFVIEYVDDLTDLISRQIGIPKNRIKIEYDANNIPMEVHVDVDAKMDPITINKIKMAQQLSRVYVSR